MLSAQVTEYYNSVVVRVKDSLSVKRRDIDNSYNNNSCNMQYALLVNTVMDALQSLTTVTSRTDLVLSVHSTCNIISHATTG